MMLWPIKCDFDTHVKDNEIIQNNFLIINISSHLRKGHISVNNLETRKQHEKTQTQNDLVVKFPEVDLLQ